MAEMVEQLSGWEQVALNTENDRFKSRYGRYLRWATVISFIVYLLMFWLTPVFEITPYRLREESIEVVDIPQAVDIPPPPQELPRPQVPIEAAPDAEVDEEVELADTLPDDFDSYVPPPPGGAGAGGNSFVAFDKKPEIVNWASPVYPEVAREMHLEGTVIVNVLVGTDGRVQQAIVIQSVHSILDQEALKAAKRCLFTPGQQRNIPVPVWVALPYAFQLF